MFSVITEHSVQAIQVAFRKTEHWLYWIQHSRMKSTLFTICWRQEMGCSACLKRCSGSCMIRTVNNRCNTVMAAVWRWDREFETRVLNICEAMLYLSFTKRYESWGAKPKTLKFSFCPHLSCCTLQNYYQTLFIWICLCGIIFSNVGI